MAGNGFREKPTTPMEGTRWTSASTDDEEWKGIVEFISRYLEMTHRDVLPAILTDFGKTVGQRLNQHELSVTLQGLVEQHRMTWFQFARLLLRSKPSCPFIFKIAEYTGASITFDYRNVLKRRLGGSWHQLGTAMGLQKSSVDRIKAETHGVQMQIDTFLASHKFPLFQSQRETAEFLIETLGKASLPEVAANVKRDLEILLQQELQLTDFKMSLEAALAKGSVEVEIVKCVTLGPPEAGKTQLKSALVNRFDRSVESTPMCTGAEVVMQRYIGGKSSWEPLTQEKLLDSLRTTVKGKEKAESELATTLPSGIPVNVLTLLSMFQQETESLPEAHEMVNGTQATAARGGKVEMLDPLLQRFSAIKRSVEEGLEEADAAKGKDLQKVRMIHLIDSGGQPAFFDIHPVIATSRSVYFLVYNMEEGLEAKPRITYRKSDFPTKELTNVNQSNLDMIKDSLLVLENCKQKFLKMERELQHWFRKSISRSADTVPVLVVGTRKKVESIASEGGKLESGCSHLPTWSQVLDCTVTGTKLFAVDSTDQDCEGVQSVREVIDKAECIYSLPLPISWVLCQLIFWAADEYFYVLTYTDLQNLCLREALVANDAEFLAMIRTFHLLGIFSFPYFEQELTLGDQWKPDAHPVFTNPDVLYRQVTKILEIAFRHLEVTEMNPEAKRNLKELQNNGRLSVGTLCHLGIPDQLGSYIGFRSYLLEQLIHWGLAAELATKDSVGSAASGASGTEIEYFIPSVFPACDNCSAVCPIPDLAFTFHMRLQKGNSFYYIPRGIFPHLVVNILTANKGYNVRPNNVTYKCLFRNAAIFEINQASPGSMTEHSYNVTLTDNMDHISIAIRPSHAKMKWSDRDCHQIVIGDFQSAINNAYEQIYCSPYPVTIACPCPCGNISKGHMAAILRRHSPPAALYIECMSAECPQWDNDCPKHVAAIVDQVVSPSPPHTGSTSESVALPKQDVVITASVLHVQVITEYQGAFLQEMNAKVIALTLRVSELIPAHVMYDIDHSKSIKDANAHLLTFLKEGATQEQVQGILQIASETADNGRMSEFASKLLQQLPRVTSTPSPSVDPLFPGPVINQLLGTPVQQQPVTATSTPHQSAPDAGGLSLTHSAAAERDRVLHEAWTQNTATQHNDVSVVFAAFDGQMNEDEVLRTISGHTCPGVLLAQQEGEKQFVHFAAEKGYTKVLKKLIETGYGINVKMKNGQTPFLLACEAGHEGTIRYLLNQDASLVFTKDAVGRSCLHFPAILRNQDLTHQLIWYMDANIDAQSNTGISPLSVACIMGDLPIVQNLVQVMALKLSCSGASDGKHRKPSRLPPLHAAAYSGHQHIMEYLLNLNIYEDSDHESILELIDPELRSEYSYTALHIAACRGHLEIVQMLVERHGCMVNAAAWDATTPLFLAAASGHEDVVMYLLAHEADADSVREVIKGTFHLTPLGEAALGRHVEVVRLLLDAGADFTFKAGGTASILALACIGGDQEVVRVILDKLESRIIPALERNRFHEIFEMPFVVSINCEDFKCAKQLMNTLCRYLGDIDAVIRKFSGKVEPHMMDILRQYKETISHVPVADLPNQGDTCRRVAGSPSSPMYHLCYDDGPHWGTEPMQLCFMFESFHKPERFHDTYEKVYVEASKCILLTLQEQGCSWDDLASAANERCSDEAAQFFTQYGGNQLSNHVLFLEQVHSGNPSAMGVCCELVSADTLQEVYSSEMAGPVAQQYFMEMSRREMKHPGQFRMKFSKHGGTGTGLRLREGGQASPYYGPRPSPAPHAAAVHRNTSADHVPNRTSTKPQPPALDIKVTPNAPAQLEDKPKLEGYQQQPGSTDVKPSFPNADDCYVSSFIREDALCLPVDCSQENYSTDSSVILPDAALKDCIWLKVQFFLATSGPSSLLQHNELISDSDPGYTGKSCRSPEQMHVPDVRASFLKSDSSVTYMSEPQDDMPPAPQPIAVVGAPHRQESDESLAESVSSEGDAAAASSSDKPAPSNSAAFVQSSSKVGTPDTSHKFIALPSIVPTKEHSLSSRVESHPAQQSAAAPHEDGSEEEDSVDGNDMTYASSTSFSTTHNPPGDESRKSSLSHNLHPSVPQVLPNTAQLKTASEGSLSVNIQTMTTSSQSIATGEEQSDNSGQSVLTPVNGCEPPLSSHPNWPPSSPPSQRPSPHHNNPVNVPSHVHSALVEMPSGALSIMESSVEAQSAATVVEALHEADLLATSSSSMHLEQPLADSCDESATAVPFTVPGFERHDSGYTGSNQFSSVLLGHHGNTESRGTMSMEGYQMEQDPKESVQRADSMAVIDNQPIGSSTKEEEEMLAYVCHQVGQKWSMLARYAGLTEDDVQEIRHAELEDRSRVMMEKVQLQGKLTWTDLLHIVHKQLHMLNTAAKLQCFLHHPVDALPLDVIQKVIDPQQYGRTILLASQCVSEHWRELARHLGIDSRQHWDVLEQSSEADEKCHELLMLWLRENTGATLQQLLEAVESTSACAGTLRQLIEMAR